MPDIVRQADAGVGHLPQGQRRPAVARVVVGHGRGRAGHLQPVRTDEGQVCQRPAERSEGPGKVRTGRGGGRGGHCNVEAGQVHGGGWQRRCNGSCCVGGGILGIRCHSRKWLVGRRGYFVLGGPQAQVRRRQEAGQRPVAVVSASPQGPRGGSKVRKRLLPAGRGGESGRVESADHGDHGIGFVAEAGGRATSVPGGDARPRPAGREGCPG